MPQFSHFSHSYRNVGKFLTQTPQNLANISEKSEIIPKHFENLTYKSLNFLNILIWTPLYIISSFWLQLGNTFSMAFTKFISLSTVLVLRGILKKGCLKRGIVKPISREPTNWVIGDLQHLRL